MGCAEWGQNPDIVQFASLSPNIAMNAATEQNLHEDVLRSRARARKNWGLVWPSGQGGRGPANNAADADGFDMDLSIVKRYLDGLGSLSQEHNRSTLANMCQYVLEGRGTEHNLTERTVKTIMWQELQLYRVNELTDHLMSEIKSPTMFNWEESMRLLVDRKQDVVAPIIRRFYQVPEIEGLQSPRWEDGYLDVFFEDAFRHLVDVFACNRLLRPSHFNLGSIQTAIVDFLRAESTSPL